MKRVWIIVALVVVLLCVVCAGVAGLLFFATTQPVARTTTVPTRVAPSPAGATPVATLPATQAAVCPPPSFSSTVVSPYTAVESVTGPVNSANGITVSSNKFTNEFPKQLTFQLDAQASAKITDLVLYVQFDGVNSTNRQNPTFSSDTQVQAKYVWEMITNFYVPPGVSGAYWWTIQDSAGNKLETAKQSFRIDDRRRQWQKISNDKLAMFWYAGGDSFGKALFERAIQTVTTLQQDTCVIVDNQVQIIVYGDRDDFLKALGPSAKGTEGGVTFSNYINGIVLMNVEPSSLEWGKGATAHELTHVVMHQKIHSPLGESSFPTWLDEGLAMYYETNPGTLDSQFSGPLRRAIQSDTLYPLRSLSGYFNSTWEMQNLAYGESYSVVDFLFRHYGRDKIAQLFQTIKVGGNVDDILRQVFGVDIDGLEVQWRKDIGAKPRVIPTRSLATPTPFPTFGLSTDATPAPRAATPTPTR